jgi:hypothetical protein
MLGFFCMAKSAGLVSVPKVNLEAYFYLNLLCRSFHATTFIWKLRKGLGLVWLLLYAHRHRSILGAAGHIILTPANQLMEE